ncbi:hypothetical protein JIY74_24625 [Vibrio harveyi]|nr:hypothetical protein [Vibrio harveyi]
MNYLVNPQQLNIFKLKIDIDRQNNKFTISSKDMNTYYNSVEFRLKNQNSINLDQVITVRDLGKIKDNNLTKEKIIDLINSKNQSANLDANLLNVKIDRKNNQFIISPIPHSNKYQGSVAISYEVEKPTSNTGKVVGGVVGGIATTAGIGGAAVYVGLNHLDKVKYLFKSMFRRKK